MKKQIIYFLLINLLTSMSFIIAQENGQDVNAVDVSKLFKKQRILSIKFSYSNKELKKNTNDSTYIKTTLSYRNKEGKWKDLNIKIRARGKSRREHCYFSPVKIKIAKSESKGSLFKGQKKLKLVLPCLLEKDNNDNVIKEYMAYKLYEIISPYNFKTRLLDITFTQLKGKKSKEHLIKGFFIEDLKKVAKRYNGEIIETSFNPIGQDDLTSIRNAFFQYMIGNTDFSISKQHNIKLLSINKNVFPIPYDFDMCGLVNTSYSFPSESIKIKSVTERKYRGFLRNTEIVKQVRQEYINKKDKILSEVNDLESFFENKKEFDEAKIYISNFFKVLVNEKRFNEEIINEMRK